MLDECKYREPAFCKPEILKIPATKALERHTKVCLIETTATAICFLGFFLLRKPHDCF